MKRLTTLLTLALSSFSFAQEKEIAHSIPFEKERGKEIESAQNLLDELEKDNAIEKSDERRGQICEGDRICGKN